MTFVFLVKYFGIGAAYLLLIPVSFYFLFFAPTAFRASWQYAGKVGAGGKHFFRHLCFVYRHFYRFGQVLLDRVALIGGASDRFKIEFHDEDCVRNALARGRGIVILTAHCGGWEIACQLFGRFNRPVRVVAYAGEAEKIRKYFDQVLRNRSFAVIEDDGSGDVTFEILAALRAGEIVAMMGDRIKEHQDIHGAAVNFLGQKAILPTGPYRVAQVARSPIIVGFVSREGTYHYRFDHSAIELKPSHDRGSREAAIQDATNQYIKRVECFLEKHPEQWFNFYDFWKVADHV